jgi:tetratricopeptide (TPR) repeat protein
MRAFRLFCIFNVSALIIGGQATAFARSTNSSTAASPREFIQITSPSAGSIIRAAQNNAPSPTPLIPPSIAPAQSQNSSGDSSAKAQILELQIGYLKDQIKVLEEKFSNYLLIVSAVFAAIFAFFGVIPFITGKAAERRAQESHKLAIESHNLAIRGETNSQQRATEVHQTFLADSKNTLELVNATLRLAKDASERAATIIQARAEKLLRELDRSAKKMLAEAKDDRDLITDPHKRSDLLSLASKIQGFEINSFMFPADLPLTSECQFIRGMELHLKQQFDDAFDAWHSVALEEKAVPQLRSLAWFWIGYEHNNLGHFPEAEKSFQNAENFENGARKFELQRIRLESRFFNKNFGLAKNSIEAFENLHKAIGDDTESDERRKHRVRAWTTFGNVLVQAGREAKGALEAEQYFTRAQGIFSQVADKDQWALFGLGQVFAYLGKSSDAEDILAGEARRNAQNEYINRIEPRTKVLARTTEIICCALVPRLRKEVHSVYGDLIESLGLVDSRLTLYSQFQKRNVPRDEFKSDLDRFVKEYGLEQFL